MHHVKIFNLTNTIEHDIGLTNMYDFSIFHFPFFMYIFYDYYCRFVNYSLW